MSGADLERHEEVGALNAAMVSNDPAQMTSPPAASFHDLRESSSLWPAVCSRQPAARRGCTLVSAIVVSKPLRP